MQSIHGMTATDLLKFITEQEKLCASIEKELKLMNDYVDLAKARFYQLNQAKKGRPISENTKKKHKVAEMLLEQDSDNSEND